MKKAWNCQVASLSLSILTAGLVSCGTGSPLASQTKIYGGTKSKLGDWSTTVGLASYGRIFCTGTAIHPQLVITAAHCVQGTSNPSRLSVYVGDGVEGGQVEAQYLAVKVAFSPKYSRSPTGWNDTAYIVLEKPIDLPASAFIPALTDADEIAEVLQEGDASLIVGFGSRDDGGFGVKFETDVVITKVSDNEIFLGSNGKDSCQGDSGGPAFARLKNGDWRVYGVVSRGGACGTGGIYGRIDANICWVQEDSGIDLGLAEYCKNQEPEAPL